MTDADDIEQRIHIRNLLHNFALTHLTTDYTEFTEEAVTEVLVLLIY